MFWIAAELPPEIPPACVASAAERYQVPAIALVSVLKQEAGKVGQAKPHDGRIYYGPAQISDLWLPHLAPYGITAAQLQHDPCVNVGVGAYVLAYYRQREPSWPRAIARYNVGSLNTPYRQDAGHRYLQKVLGHWKRIHEKWSHP